jgi:hypothetical protein
MGKPLFKASDGGRFDILREGRTPLNVNSGRGLGRKYSFDEGFALKPFRTACSRPYSKNLSNI